MINEPQTKLEAFGLLIDIIIGLSWKLLLIACCIKYLFY